MMQNNVSLFLCLSYFLKYSWGLELTACSGPIIIKQGHSHKIFCQSDVAYDACIWTHGTDGSYYKYLCSVDSKNLKTQNGTK